MQARMMSALVAALVLFPGSLQAQSAMLPKISCDKAAGFAIAASRIKLPTKGAAISAATLTPGTGGSSTAAGFVPEHCLVTGVIASIDPNAPPINFQVAIPTAWNGKAYQIGGNGANGFVPLLVNLPRDFQGSPVGATLAPHAQNPIARGYAVYGGDSGHGGASPPGPGTPGAGGAVTDYSWTKNDEAYKNLGYESIKKTHDAAIAVIEHLYGVRPRLNYFGGESQGGREAMQAAARYPRDYHGVIASVPLLSFASTIVSRPLRIKAQYADGAWLPASKGAVIGKETMRLCDGLDGLADGVISNYVACNRLGNPDITPRPFQQLRCPDGQDSGEACLSDKQLATLDSWHRPWAFGVKMFNGETTFPGFPIGAEDRGGWADALRAKPDPAKPPTPTAYYHLNVRYADKPGGGDLLTRTPAELASTVQDLSAILDPSTDLRAFFARGGKIVMYSAANDYLTNPATQFIYFDEVKKKAGAAAVERSMRYYVTPYAPHNSMSKAAGSEEPLPQYADLMGTLERWVEEGVKPPDFLLQTGEMKAAPYTVTRSRPLCRYPNYPRYKGAGDTKAAESYVCAAP